MQSSMQLPNGIQLNDIKGFLADDEAEALYQYGEKAASFGPLLEVGSYCGKSTVILGSAAKKHGATVFAVDHHRGSEEHQLGEEYHDSELYDESINKYDTFKAFRKNMAQAELEETVVPIVASSKVAAKHWVTPLSFVFIDGGHSMEAAMADYQSWASAVMPGGYLLIHDLFPNPEEGGQAPITIYRLALASGLFDEVEVVNTLGILKKTC
ncbi:MAG: class I SAM-dependent methyltransferase [Cellvibrionales bacterium]|nr:class I SAM-dependent methyltransferase [Cellvibrionales bacterium]